MAYRTFDFKCDTGEGCGATVYDVIVEVREGQIVDLPECPNCSAKLNRLACATSAYKEIQNNGASTRPNKRK